MSRKIRVLVIDDSAFIRKVISEILSSHPSIEVVGTAFNGQDALEKVEILKPDVATLDLHMPVLDGVGFLRRQMKRRPLPVVVCSIASEGGKLVGEAFEAGAFEYVHKPTALASQKVFGIRDDLIRKVLAAAVLSHEQMVRLLRNQQETPRSVPPPAFPEKLPWQAVLIGASTGGPGALRQILPMFPENFPLPVGVVIHMPEGYTRFFANRLNEICPLQVLEAAHEMPFLPGNIIIGRAGFPFRLTSMGEHILCDLSGTTQESFIPSVNDLFRSGAEIFQGRVAGVVLTGMGNDGTAGAGWIKAQGGMVIAESERTAVIYGMPRTVIEAGLADHILPLDEIVPYLLRQLQ